MRILPALAVLLCLLPGLAPAADTDAPAVTATPAIAQDCPDPAAGLSLAQVSQADCCKGHKGLCGCRAGKLVCCDNTVSKEPGCTCHGDEGVPQ